MTSLSPREIFIVLVFLFGAAIANWGLFVQPNQYEWVESGETTAIIHTILPSQTLLGKKTLTALVDIDGGVQTLVKLPMNSRFVEGREIPIAILKDSAGSGKSKYVYKIN